MTHALPSRASSPQSRPRRRSALWILLAMSLVAITVSSEGQIRRDPNGVNVNAQGATSVFITFGGLDQQIPVEASWCGALIPAAPDLGQRCDPSTIFGRLPLRFDQSRLSATGASFTDIMTIPPSVARRAYQAAARGETSTFFYVRRFASTIGGPDEYVFVTCRLTGGGARTPLALLDVDLAFDPEVDVLSVQTEGRISPFRALVAYNGSGRLRGRWEVVKPGDEPPTSRDLLTEATLPPEERAAVQRYSLIERFDVFLPPSGRVVVPGPDPARLPTTLDGIYQILFRVEAGDDKEGDSNLATVGAGNGVVHSAAVAGFPMPVLRYVVGQVSEGESLSVKGQLRALAPAPDTALSEVDNFSWTPIDNVLVYRLDIETEAGEPVLAAVLQQGIGSYAAPPWVAESERGDLRWRVVALGSRGEVLTSTEWRPLKSPSSP